MTEHAELRISDRSRMQPPDVLNLLERCNPLSIGCSTRNSKFRTEYLLFYAPEDDNFHIAVVSHNRTHLVSVWPLHFVRPDHLDPVTPQMLQRARYRVLTSGYRTLGLDTWYDVEVRVFCNYRLEVSRIVECMKGGDLLQSLGSHNPVRDTLSCMFEAVERVRHRFAAPIWYEIRALDLTMGTPVWWHPISHQRCRKIFCKI